MSRHINIALALLAIVATLVMFATSGEPVIPLLRNTRLEPLLQSIGRTNSIAFNLAVGYLVSGIFWLLVVYLPDRARRSVLRENLSRSYRRFKEAALQILLWSSIGVHDSRMPEELCDHRKFKEFFEANKSAHWYAAMNGLQGSEIRMRELVLELEIFADEVGYVLNNANIQDIKVHRLFKVLKENIYRLHSNVHTDEQVKYVGRFLWEVLARWSFVDGQSENDIIQETIERL